MTTDKAIIEIDRIFTDYIAGHPDAGPLPKCIIGQPERVGMVIGLNGVSKLITSCFETQGINEILISSSGYTSTAGGNSFSVIAELAQTPQLENDAQAKEVWQWIWAIAVEGNAPNLIPRMRTEFFEGDHIWYIRVTRNPDQIINPLDLWEQDCKLEKQRRTDGDGLKQEIAEKEALTTKQLLGTPAFKFRLKP